MTTTTRTRVDSPASTRDLPLLSELRSAVTTIERGEVPDLVHVRMLLQDVANLPRNVGMPLPVAFVAVCESLQEVVDEIDARGATMTLAELDSACLAVERLEESLGLLEEPRACLPPAREAALHPATPAGIEVEHLPATRILGLPALGDEAHLERLLSDLRRLWEASRGEGDWVLDCSALAETPLRLVAALIALRLADGPDARKVEIHDAPERVTSRELLRVLDLHFEVA